MLGFTPIGPDACDAIDPDLVAVDASLSNGGYDALSALVDAWVVVKVGRSTHWSPYDRVGVVNADP